MASVRSAFGRCASEPARVYWAEGRSKPAEIYTLREAAGMDEKGWRKLRSSCFDRDKRICQRCGTQGGNISAHHIIPREEKNSKNNLNNLVTLCYTCHNWVEMNLKYHPDLKTKIGIQGSWPSIRPAKAISWHNIIQPGYRQPGDRTDIWVKWVKNGRKDAAMLFEMYSPYPDSGRTFLAIKDDLIDELLTWNPPWFEIDDDTTDTLLYGG